MEGGFTFCGVDIADIGLEYAPENKDTYVYTPTLTTIQEQSFDGHEGGYIYGIQKKPKEFTLRCYYEGEHIAHGIMEKAFNLFKVGKSGMLIFKRRPWCYYYATVTSVPDISEMFNYMNGMFVVTMKATYPFARGLNINYKPTDTEEQKQIHLLYSSRTDKFHQEMMENTAVLDTDDMVPPTTHTNPSEGLKLLYNPGTERAKVGIVISGNAGVNGVIIKNHTTNQECKFVRFTPETGSVVTDSMCGKTFIENSNQLAFLYHDYGFLELEPAFPILRNIFVNYSVGTNKVNTLNILYDAEEEREWYSSKYVYLKYKLDNATYGKWYKIATCLDKHTLIVEQNISLPENAEPVSKFQTSIVLMNEIEIIGSSGTSISKISFRYKPTYS